MERAHGSASRYRERNGCRCDECRQASTRLSARERANRSERLASKAGDLPHGLSTYRNWGCRCDICRQAASDANRAERQARYAQFQAGLIQREHGTLNTYTSYGCRCLSCTAASSERVRSERLRRSIR